MISFFVPGIAKPSGSKRGFALKKGGIYTGRVAMVDMSGGKGKDWRHDVKSAARDAYAGPLLAGPLFLSLTFYVTRPKNHFGSGKNTALLKADAALFPTTRPDVTKLIRSVEDALTGLVYEDDSQIVTQVAEKRYADKPGCQITIAPATPQPPEDVR